MGHHINTELQVSIVFYTNLIESTRFGSDMTPVFVTTEVEYFPGEDWLVTLFTGPTDDEQRPFHAIYGEADTDELASYFEKLDAHFTTPEVNAQMDEDRETYDNIVHAGRGDWIRGANILARKAAR